MSAHIAGPWRVYKTKLSDKANYQGNIDWIVETADEEWVCDTGTEADANLIAAAPALLRELENLVRRFRACCISSGSDEEYADEAVADAREVIAEARGQD